jgi:hypothetical protein
LGVVPLRAVEVDEVDCELPHAASASPASSTAIDVRHIG